LSASPDIKVIDDPDIKDVDSLLVKQKPPESSAYHAVPIEQQMTLHDFLLSINQGTFSIPCVDKIYCPLPGMDPVAWHLEKLLCCLGPWLCLLVRISRRNLLIALWLH